MTSIFLIENRVQDLNGDGRFNFEDTDNDSIFDFYTDSYEGAEFDFFLPGEGTGSGLLIWHIDHSIIDYALYYNVVEGDPKHKGVDLVEADGIQDLDGPDHHDRVVRQQRRQLPRGEQHRAHAGHRPQFASVLRRAERCARHRHRSCVSNRMSFRVRFAGSTLRRTGRSNSMRLPWAIRSPRISVARPGLEVVAVDEAGALHAWDSQGGRCLRRSRPGARFLHEPLVGPVGGEGRPGIVAISDDGRVFQRRRNGSAVGPRRRAWSFLRGAFADSAVGALWTFPSLTGDRSSLVMGSRFADPESTYSVVTLLDLSPAGGHAAPAGRYGAAAGDLSSSPIVPVSSARRAGT